jgi:hypothetical protein
MGVLENLVVHVGVAILAPDRIHVDIDMGGFGPGGRIVGSSGGPLGVEGGLVVVGGSVGEGSVDGIPGEVPVEAEGAEEPSSVTVGEGAPCGQGDGALGGSSGGEVIGIAAVAEALEGSVVIHLGAPDVGGVDITIGDVGGVAARPAGEGPVLSGLSFIRSVAGASFDGDRACVIVGQLHRVGVFDGALHALDVVEAEDSGDFAGEGGGHRWVAVG